MAILEYDPQAIWNVVLFFWSYLITVWFIVPHELNHRVFLRYPARSEFERLERKVEELEKKLSEVEKE